MADEMNVMPGGARLLRAGEAQGDDADLAWALDTDLTSFDTFDHVIAAGTVLERHAHTTPLAARITSGRITFAFDDGEVVDLRDDDVIGLPAGLVHVETVPEDGDVTMLVAHQGSFQTYEP